MKSQFKCIGCDKAYPLTDIRFQCDCGELLEVITDFASFGRSPQQWKAAFDAAPNVSAFARYRDILLPDLPADAVVSLHEGDTPLYEANQRASEYFGIDTLRLKHEGMNPTLSFKDRGMVAGISWAKHLGIPMVVCASTGDTSAAMAAYAAHAGIKPVVLLPKGKISIEQLSQAISYGAKVLELKTDFDGCMKIVQQLVHNNGLYLLNSMNSVRIEGQKAIGIETLHQLGWRVPDYFVIPVGNAGNISALGKGLRELHELGVIDRLPRLVGVEAERANPLYLSYKDNFETFTQVKAGQTVASAIQIGNPVSFGKAARELRAFDGIMEQVTEREIMDAKAAADNSGVAVCPNSATALAGLKKLRAHGTIKRHDSVVVILTAHGLKFSAAANRYYLDETSTYSNAPLTLDPRVEDVEKALGL